MEAFLKSLGTKRPEGAELGRVTPAVLAYVGDSVYECHVRLWVALRLEGPINRFHRETVRYVNASAQADIVGLMGDILTESEREIIRKGRNVKTGRPPRNADVGDYRLATGWEALIGYLYLSGEMERLQHLISCGLQRLSEKEEAPAVEHQDNILSASSEVSSQ